MAGSLPPDRDNALYYLAGPERFVRGAVGAVGSVEVAKHRVRFEEFDSTTPYAERTTTIASTSPVC